MPQQNKKKDFWNHMSKHMDESITLEESKLLQAIEEDLNPKSTWTVLDIGCGAGRFMEYFAGRFKSVYGCDISPVMLERAAKRVSRFENCQLKELNFPQEFPTGLHFDLAVAAMSPAICDEHSFHTMLSLADCGALTKGVHRKNEIFEAIYEELEYPTRQKKFSILDCVEILKSLGYQHTYRTTKEIWRHEESVDDVYRELLLRYEMAKPMPEDKREILRTRLSALAVDGIVTSATTVTLGILTWKK